MQIPKFRDAMFGVSTTSLILQKRNRSNWNMVSNSFHWTTLRFKTESIFSLVIYNFLPTDLLVTYFHEFWIYESTNPRFFFTKNVLFSFKGAAKCLFCKNKHCVSVTIHQSHFPAFYQATCMVLSKKVGDCILNILAMILEFIKMNL